MRLNKRLLVTGAASALLVSGSLGISSAASASTGDHGSSNDSKVGTLETNVVTWQDANLRDEPTTDSTIDRRVGAGTTLLANCWVFGEEVTEGDITNDKWIELDTSNPFDDEYIWAGSLEGDETGGVPNQC